jgi:carboxyl-terminal processing protease
MRKLISSQESNSTSSSYKEFLPFLITVTLVLGILLGIITTKFLTAIGDDSAENNGSNMSNSSFFDSEYFNEFYEILENKYIEDMPGKEEVTYGLIKGLVSSLDSKYTFFLTPEEANAYEEDKNPDFEGIGVTLKFDQEYTIIESVLRGNPAEAAGFLPGDVVLEVNNEDMSGKYPAAVADKVKGPKGTKVKIKIFRNNDNGGETLEIEVQREKINVDNVSWESLENGIVKINISQFNDTSAMDFNESWDNIVKEISSQKSDIKGIVLDLRNNPGGYVYSVKHVLEEFLKDNQVLFKEQIKDENEVDYKDTRVGKFEDIPLSVIVNEGSASASEILAAAIQYHNRGKVVGMPTVGKGVEQELITLDDGSILIVVFQKWLTPAGEQISEESPIKPDYEVDYTSENFKAGMDPQKDKAVEVLQTKLSRN